MCCEAALEAHSSPRGLSGYSSTICGSGFSQMGRCSAFVRINVSFKYVSISRIVSLIYILILKECCITNSIYVLWNIVYLHSVACWLVFLFFLLLLFPNYCSVMKTLEVR